MFELSAMAIGFLGSFHCVAMCGPIALALSGGNANTMKYLAGRTLYNSGRIFTYAILGLLAGLAGHTLLMAGFQQSVSIAIGIFMILSVIFIHYLPGRWGTNPVALKLNALIRKVFSRVLKKQNGFSLFFAGLANGILPCGFVYLAMAGAAATQTPLDGALYMVYFGLGTFPAMMAVAAFGRLTGIKARSFLVRAAPVMMIVLGTYFIYRGFSIENKTCCNHSKSTIVSAVP